MGVQKARKLADGDSFRVMAGLDACQRMKKDIVCKGQVVERETERLHPMTSKRWARKLTSHRRMVYHAWRDTISGFTRAKIEFRCGRRVLVSLVVREMSGARNRADDDVGFMSA